MGRDHANALGCADVAPGQRLEPWIRCANDKSLKKLIELLTHHALGRLRRCPDFGKEGTRLRIDLLTAHPLLARRLTLYDE
jgi:hypothetical protein